MARSDHSSGTVPSRRTVLKAFAAAPLAALLPAGCERFAPAERPDIVILVADSMRAASLPMYGYPGNTAPFLAQLATQSTLFTRCYSTATWTRPAVTGILTGLYLSQHLQWSFEYPSRAPSFPQALRRAGYRTGFFTAINVIGKGYGMEDHFDHVSSDAAGKPDSGRLLTDDCMAWLAAPPTTPAEPSPVLAYVHYFPPHGPYDPPQEFLEEPEPRSMPAMQVEYSLGGNSAGRIPLYQARVAFSHDPAVYSRRYDANLRYADSLLAGFMERWAGVRGDRRTVFIVTSDHGECLEEHARWFSHGRILADQLLHVPLLIHDTGRPRGRVIDTPVSHVDISSTALQLAGAWATVCPNGVDLLGRVPADRTLVSQVGMQVHESGWALTRGRWRLIYNDCPRDGLAVINSVVAGSCRNPGLRTPLPRPETELAAPVQLGDGVVLTRLGLGSSYLLAGRSYRITGQLREEGRHPFAGGILELRLGSQDTQPVQLADCRLEASTGCFTAELPALVSSRTDGTPIGLLEVRWTGREGAAADWVPVLSPPLLSPRPMDPDLDLLGVISDRSVVLPGDTLRVTYVWQVRKVPSKRLAVFVHFRHAGRTVLRNDHLFFNADLAGASANRKELKPLFSPAILDEHTVEDQPIRFDETYWVQVPADAAPGHYQVVVGLFDLEGYDPDRPEHYPKQRSATVALELNVVSERELLRRGLEERGSTALQVLHDPGRESAGLLERELPRLAARYPSQGHLHYLLATQSDASAREELLQRCLELTPQHRAALAEAAAWGSPWAEARQRIAPATQLDVRFAPGLHLYGVTLVLSATTPVSVYVTLFWECLALRNEVFSGELHAHVGAAESSEKTGSVWWFLGGRVRPTCDWQLGEAVVETIRLPQLPATGQLELTLQLTERWSWVYSNRRRLAKVPLQIGASKAWRATVQLGTWELADLPVADHDPLEDRRRDPAQYQLYDLLSDPEESTNRVTEEPAVFAGMQQELLQLIDTLVPDDQLSTTPIEDLPEEDRRRLEAIGYVV